MKVGFAQWIGMSEEQYDLCNEGMECPTQMDVKEININYHLPSNTPVGNSWRGFVFFSNENNETIACIELDTFIMK